MLLHEKKVNSCILFEEIPLKHFKLLQETVHSHVLGQCTVRLTLVWAVIHVLSAVKFKVN
jgi:hypothetical protein